MDNWRDYVGFQSNIPVPGSENNQEICHVSVLTVNIPKSEAPTRPANAPGLNPVKSTVNLSISILKKCIPVTEYTLSEEEVGDKIEEVFARFRSVPIKSDLELEKEKHRVAKETRRGVAMTNWNDVWFYKGGTPYDAPVIVSEYVTNYEPKYYVFIHPNFDKYGFNAARESNG
jgi:hypothetical protein